MSKIKSNVDKLADLKKSNQARKLFLAVREGFKTVEEYRKDLEAKVAKEGKTSSSTKSPKEKKSSPASGEPVLLDFVIAFDTTGSMNSYIESVKKHVQKLVGEMFSQTPGLQIKIVAFGDYCDMKSATEFGKAYQESSLTDDQKEIISFIKSAKNTSGGDGDEFYELVIKKVVEETPWRKNAKKAFLLIGDARPHSLGYSYPPIIQNNQIDWKKECQQAAAKGIQIDTLAIHEGMTFYKEVAGLTNGLYLPFKNAKNIGDLAQGLTYARTSKETFMKKFEEVKTKGDASLTASYVVMSKTLLDE